MRSPGPPDPSDGGRDGGYGDAMRPMFPWPWGGGEGPSEYEELRIGGLGEMGVMGEFILAPRGGKP